MEDQYVQFIGNLHSGTDDALQQAAHTVNVYTDKLYLHWKNTNDRMSRFKTPLAPFVQYTDAEFNTALALLKQTATDMGSVKSFLFPGMAGAQTYYRRPTADQKNRSKPTVIEIAIGIYQTNELNGQVSAISLRHH